MSPLLTLWQEQIVALAGAEAPVQEHRQRCMAELRFQDRREDQCHLEILQ